MSIPITCSCGQTLSAPDDTAGGTFFCWSCGRPVSVPSTLRGGAFTSTPPPSPARYQDTAPVARRFTYPTSEWQRVRAGLASANIAAGIFLSWLLILWILILDRTIPSKSVTLLLLVLQAVAAVMGVIGAAQCAAAPDESAARGPVTVAAWFLGAGAVAVVILGFIGVVGILGNEPVRISEGFWTFMQKLMLLGIGGGFLLFMFFQLITALHFGERGIGTGVISFWLAPTVFISISPIGAPLALGGPLRGGMTETWLNLLMLMLMGWTAWFVVNNTMLRTSIETAERRQLE